MNSPYKEEPSSVNLDELRSNITPFSDSTWGDVSGCRPPRERSGGKTRITCPPKVANNVDKLKVSFWVSWRDNTFLDELDSIKQSIQNTSHLQEKPYHCPGGFQWNVQRTGTRLFSFRLLAGDLAFLINTRNYEDQIPTVSLEIGSESCWSPGFNDIYYRFTTWISAIGGDIQKNQISEVHLAADFIGLGINSIDVDIKNRWITRSKKFITHGSQSKLETFSLGKGILMLRIYDKIQELKKSPQKLFTFMEAWGVEVLSNTDITRVEFQVRREILKNIKISPTSETGIDTFDDLCDSFQSIWKYCTHDWARHCSHKVDKEQNHQSRANNSEFWNSVSKIQWSGSLARTKQKPRPKKDYAALVKQFVGIGMTLAAFHKVNSGDIDHIIDIGKSIFDEAITSFYRNEETEFVRRLDKKQREIYESVSTLHTLKPEHPSTSNFSPPFPPS